MNLKRRLGFTEEGKVVSSSKRKMLQYINLKLAALDLPYFDRENKFLEIAEDLIKNHREKDRLLTNYLCPSDQRIQNFLDRYLSDLGEDYKAKLPNKTFILDRYGIARFLSLPYDKDSFKSEIIESYKIKQGVLHNPLHDRRTTKGVFHVAEGGLPIPDDKKSVPKAVFANILKKALTPPDNLMELPFTATSDTPARCFVSLLLRPKVSPEVKGVSYEKSMEIRFFAPGNLVSNLDFVESIFGNAGDPYLPENDAGLDVLHWSGHTGCVILAPHLIRLTKKEVGLPHVSEATERQKRDGMCWEKEDELYNNGQAFKVTARTDEGVIVTVIADNYFGYSKKEVKTQIGYAANLLGNTEEEHAGGALAFPSYNLGDEFHNDSMIEKDNHTFEDVVKNYSEIMDIQPEGYGIDKKYPDIIYVPENVEMSVPEQKVFWVKDGKEYSIKLLPEKTYILPEGYKIRLEKNPYAPSWRLVGTVAEGTFCHKPSTVSGGGKSEISKSVTDSIIFGPFFVADMKKDFELIDEIINKDYSNRFKERIKYSKSNPPRSLLSSRRSLGSTIKMLTPSSEFTDEYNAWLESIPQYVKGLVFIIKRFYRPEWGKDWKKYFTVDVVDGNYGHELKYNNRKLVAIYLRVGMNKDGSWRTFKLRQDFVAAEKLQMEDDISVSTVIPAKKLEFLNKKYTNPSVKFVDNCEYRFFQRPDEAINRGYDKQAEYDLSSPNSFLSNFQPLNRNEVKEIYEDSINFDLYTEPMKNLIKSFLKGDENYMCSSSHPRLVNGVRTKNPRYLQNRPDMVNPKQKYIAEIGTRLFRKIPLDKPVYTPVNAVLPGRRNNPPEKGIRPLAVYNPIHYQELPELFMDFICSLTGKSPSTTGAGSEGALTKAPFNALLPIIDINNALVSFILTGYNGFTTAAGFIGPNIKVDHDISLLIPEIWCRLNVNEKDPKFLIENGHLEKLEDFEYNGEKILASRLGYRITEKFVHTFFGRVFENPIAVFNNEILKPESQSMEVFVDGIKNITEAQKRVAEAYFRDGSYELALPPIKALLSIMVKGEYEGKDISDSEIRNMFTYEYMIKSSWYYDRLKAKQKVDIKRAETKIKYLKEFIENTNYDLSSDRFEFGKKLKIAEERLSFYKTEDYVKSLFGTIGKDPFEK